MKDREYDVPEINDYKYIRQATSSDYINICEGFHLFHSANPKVFELIHRIALDFLMDGWKKSSMSLIFERIRWLYSVKTRGDKYKLNNNYRAFYSRALMLYDPRMKDFFYVRRQSPMAGSNFDVSLERMGLVPIGAEKPTTSFECKEDVVDQLHALGYTERCIDHLLRQKGMPRTKDISLEDLVSFAERLAQVESAF